MYKFNFNIADFYVSANLVATRKGLGTTMIVLFCGDFFVRACVAGEQKLSFKNFSEAYNYNNKPEKYSPCHSMLGKWDCICDFFHTHTI